MKKIYLHIGHGGSDGGAVGAVSREKDINLKIGTELYGQLKKTGYEALMSRTTDVKNSGAPKAANDWGADLVISLHCNSASSNTARGTETLIIATGGKAESFARLVNPLVKGAMETLDRGVKVQNVEILRETNAPAVLIEVGFISNLQEEQKLNNSKIQGEVAKVISQAVEEFFGDSTGGGCDYAEHWAKEYIDKAKAAGVMSGYPDGSFRPEEAITRAQAAVIVCKLLDLKG